MDANDEASSTQPTRRSKRKASAKATMTMLSSSNKKTRTSLRLSKTPVERADRTTASSTIPTVTPGFVSPKRRIRFPSPSSPPLPQGVVNIFSPAEDVYHRATTLHSHLGPLRPFAPRTYEERMRSNYRDHLVAYGKDFCTYARQQEQKQTPRPWMFDPEDDGERAFLDILPNQPLLTTKMRTTLVSWLGEVAQEYRLSESAYHLSISILDAFLREGPTRVEMKEHPEWYGRLPDNEDGDDSDDDESNHYVSDDEEEHPDKKVLVRKTDFQAYGWYVMWRCFCTESLILLTSLQRLSLDSIQNRRSSTATLRAALLHLRLLLHHTKTSRARKHCLQSPSVQG